MFSAPVFGLRGLGWTLGRASCVAFLVKTPYSHSPSAHPEIFKKLFFPADFSP